MRKSLLFGAVLLIASCTVQKEEEFESPIQHRYHAVAEEPVDAETRVYADSKLRVRWNEGDHISIFERNTYNQEFEFLGDTGDTAGDFDLVESSGYHSGGDIEDGHVYAVYPYEKKNKCDFDGKLTVTFPSVQHYKKDSFGVGANVMVAKTNTMDLRFMHVGGYRTFKLYGEGVSVSSVRIESNGSEYLSGRTDVVIGEDGKPEVSFVESTSNSKSVELVCDTPVTLGATDAEAVEFWFVLPPGTLTQGFTVTVTDINGNEFTKSTSNVIEIKSGVKKSMPAFEVEIENGQPNNVIYYASTDGNVVMPYKTNVFGANIVSNEYVDGQGVMTFDGDVTTIGDDAFYDCTTLLSITVPKSVTTIGETAFSGCSKLWYVGIPEGVTRIGYSAFFRCSSLQAVEIPKTVTLIAQNAFSSCTSLTSVAISYGVTYIGPGAFGGCTKLKSVSIPATVTTLEKSVFYGCTQLESVSIGANISTISETLFRGCTSLKNVTLSESITSIGVSAFYGCSSLESISLPSNLSIIDRQAFINCSKLSSIIIPAGVVSIGGGAFSGCSSLTSITIPDSVTSFGANTFASCTSLTNVRIPIGVTVLYDGCFSNCISLTSISIPDTVTEIGNSTFNGCKGLTSITIPCSVLNIGAWAFQSCSSLASVCVLAAEPPSANTDFLKNTNDCPIYVPDESVNAYTAASYWSDYADRIQAIPPEATVIPGFDNIDM